MLYQLFLFYLGFTIAEDFEYVLLFLENYSADPPKNVELYVASRSEFQVNVTITNPNGGNGIISSPINFTLDPNVVRMVTISPDARQTGELENKAIKVVGSGDIIVYALNRNLYSTDGFTAFSIDQVEKEYYAMAYTADRTDDYTQIGLVAVEDGATDVDVTVPADTTVQWNSQTYTAGQTFRITLSEKYKTAQVKSETGDLTGAVHLFIILVKHILLSIILIWSNILLLKKMN